MTDSKPEKPLKDQNRWQLWLTIAANALVLYAVCQTGRLAELGPKALLTGASNLLPVALALVVTSVANGLIGTELKARLVFLRWHDALPAHRAFSELAKRDPRIDFSRLRKAIGTKIPTDPKRQNALWYSLYKSIESDPSVLYIHREFLFTRDYAALAGLFLIIGAPICFFASAGLHVKMAYCAGLVAQFLLVRKAACTYGNRFVCTVLAIKATAST